MKTKPQHKVGHSHRTSGSGKKNKLKAAPHTDTYFQKNQKRMFEQICISTDKFLSRKKCDKNGLNEILQNARQLEELKNGFVELPINTELDIDTVKILKKYNVSVFVDGGTAIVVTKIPIELPIGVKIKPAMPEPGQPIPNTNIQQYSNNEILKNIKKNIDITVFHHSLAHISSNERAIECATQANKNHVGFKVDDWLTDMLDYMDSLDPNEFRKQVNMIESKAFDESPRCRIEFKHPQAKSSTVLIVVCSTEQKWHLVTAFPKPVPNEESSTSASHDVASYNNISTKKGKQKKNTRPIPTKRPANKAKAETKFIKQQKKEEENNNKDLKEFWSCVCDISSHNDSDHSKDDINTKPSADTVKKATENISNVVEENLGVLSLITQFQQYQSIEEVNDVQENIFTTLDEMDKRVNLGAVRNLLTKLEGYYACIEESQYTHPEELEQCQTVMAICMGLTTKLITASYNAKHKVLHDNNELAEAQTLKKLKGYIPQEPLLTESERAFFLEQLTTAAKDHIQEYKNSLRSPDSKNLPDKLNTLTSLKPYMSESTYKDYHEALVSSYAYRHAASVRTILDLTEKVAKAYFPQIKFLPKKGSTRGRG